MITKTTLDPKKVMRAMHKLRALNHPVRLKIIEYLNDRKFSSVGSIQFFIREEQSVTSQHLRILRDNNIVECEQEGKYIIYNINMNEMFRILPMIKELAEGYEMRPSEKREYDNSFRTMRHYS